MIIEEYIKESLWPILVETVHASIMYPIHKAYTREEIMREKPDVTASELVNKLNISLGEALVILKELTDERKTSN